MKTKSRKDNVSNGNALLTKSAKVWNWTSQLFIEDNGMACSAWQVSAATYHIYYNMPSFKLPYNSTLVYGLYRTNIISAMLVAFCKKSIAVLKKVLLCIIRSQSRVGTPASYCACVLETVTHRKSMLPCCIIEGVNHNFYATLSQWWHHKCSPEHVM